MPDDNVVINSFNVWTSSTTSPNTIFFDEQITFATAYGNTHTEIEIPQSGENNTVRINCSSCGVPESEGNLVKHGFDQIGSDDAREPFAQNVVFCYDCSDQITYYDSIVYMKMIEKLLPDESKRNSLYDIALHEAIEDIEEYNQNMGSAERGNSDGGSEGIRRLAFIYQRPVGEFGRGWLAQKRSSAVDGPGGD